MFGNYIGKLILASETTPPPTMPPTDGTSLWDKLTEPNSDGLVQEFCKWLFKSLGEIIFNTASPLVVWGCKIAIVASFTMYYCSGEKKYIATIIKCGVIYILFLTIQEALQ